MMNMTKCVLNVSMWSAIAILSATPLFAQTKIDLGKQIATTTSVPLSTVAQSIRHIPLETTDDCLLSNELNVCCTKEFIFVLDRQTKTVYRFSMEGKLLNRIGKQGQGPGEYILCMSLYVDTTRKTVFVLDSNSHKFYQYDYAGKFINSFKMDCFTYSMEKLGADYVYTNAFYNRDKKELFKMNASGTTLKSTNTPYPATKGMSIEVPFFYNYQSKVFYKVPIDNTVYEVTADLKKQPVYRFELGQYTPDPEERTLIIKGNQGTVRQAQGVVSITGMLENNSRLLVSYTYNKEEPMAVYDKQSGKIYIPKEGNQFGWKDDLGKGPAVKFSSSVASARVSTEPNQLVTLLFPNEIDWDKYKQGTFAQTLQSMSEDDNPIVQIVTLK